MYTALSILLCSVVVFINAAPAVPVVQPVNVGPAITNEDALRLQRLKIEAVQNESAKYAFSTNVDDQINDLTQDREEVRDGLTVRGRYSYSDGYHKRTVHYEADQNGYRITGEQVVPLHDGPQVNPVGIASVHNKAHGSELKYSVQSVPVEEATIVVETGMQP